MLGSAGQALVLLIPTVGLGYTLFSLGRRFTSLLWNWGKPNAPRRAVSAVCFVSAAGLLGFMWLPQVPLPGREPQTAAVSLGPFSSVSWQPIAADERGTVQDVVSDAGAGPAVASPTVAPATQPTPQPTALPPVTDVQTRDTPEPTVAATPQATPESATTQTTLEAAVQGTPVPRATLTSTPPRGAATATVPPTSLR